MQGGFEWLHTLAVTGTPVAAVGGGKVQANALFTVGYTAELRLAGLAFTNVACFKTNVGGRTQSNGASATETRPGVGRVS